MTRHTKRYHRQYQPVSCDLSPLPFAMPHDIRADMQRHGASSRCLWPAMGRHSGVDIPWYHQPFPTHRARLAGLWRVTSRLMARRMQAHSAPRPRHTRAIPCRLLAHPQDGPDDAKPSLTRLPESRREASPSRCNPSRRFRGGRRQSAPPARYLVDSA